ncbi:hypothetical protein [Pseudoteredinibacter isoporae]|uniref:Lipoprotein n=1 Tax=Pseudoteredinibacter isoporae TaxID=570281 RepID=A0A7X0JUN5_9GAMM|nr:hypothetical protein [Pseudoteredinibacter isoporae]MBB6521711.1 hypothetical protein [Pseudoteredinibacter isoporae]NHO87259.1 hypothetical protein [Pseudoteredinibacter isoporae]NIB23109.1 hypothetical protein [Pseudoteredinibacter isoporae]
MIQTRKRFRTLKLASAFLMVLFLVACSSQPKGPEVTERLVTHISEDGSKRFQYVMTMQRKKGAGRGGFKGGGKGMGGKGMANRGGQSGGKNRTDMIAQMQEKMKARGIEAMEAKLDETEFCRDGYMVLSEQFTMARLKINGECKESATEDDKKNFPNVSKHFEHSSSAYSMPSSLPDSP